MEKIDIKKSMQELAEKIKKDYPDSNFYFYVDDYTATYKVALMPSFVNLILLSKNIEADVMYNLLKIREKEVAYSDEEFLKKYKNL